MKLDDLDENGLKIKETMHSLSADAKEGLALEFPDIRRTADVSYFLIVTCTLHRMNHMMQIPCEKFFSDGSFGARNVAQMFRVCFGLQKEHESIE